MAGRWRPACAGEGLGADGDAAGRRIHCAEAEPDPVEGFVRCDGYVGPQEAFLRLTQAFAQAERVDGLVGIPVQLDQVVLVDVALTFAVLADHRQEAAGGQRLRAQAVGLADEGDAAGQAAPTQRKHQAASVLLRSTVDLNDMVMAFSAALQYLTTYPEQ